MTTTDAASRAQGRSTQSDYISEISHYYAIFSCLIIPRSFGTANCCSALKFSPKTMNKNCHRLVMSKLRGMLCAVAEFASSHSGGERATSGAPAYEARVPQFRLMALAAMLLLGSASMVSYAQIVAAPGSGAQVIQTQNGLNQVNVARPSSAGVSVNTFSQFDVQRQGAILNNSPTIVQTQQAGYINGNTTIRGASVNLAGSNTSANGTLALNATSGDMNLSSATTTAGGTLLANASGTLTNDAGNASGSAVQVSAGALSNALGQIVSGSTLDATVGGALNNRSGTFQAAGRETIRAGSLDNTAGRIVSLNGDGLSVSTGGALVNGAGGTIGGNGALDVDALSSHSDSQSEAVTHEGSTLTGNNVTIVATGSGAKDAAGNALDGDINSRGTTITGGNVTMATTCLGWKD